MTTHHDRSFREPPCTYRFDQHPFRDDSERERRELAKARQKALFEALKHETSTSPTLQPRPDWSHSIPQPSTSSAEPPPPPPSPDLNRGAYCKICDKYISRRGDMPRHRRTHLPVKDKFKLMHRCPMPGCTFKNLQRSNVDTHIRTHTGAKTQACPDCDFRTADPGSLTRHRKRLHGYVPRARSRVLSAVPLGSAAAAAAAMEGDPRPQFTEMNEYSEDDGEGEDEEMAAYEDGIR